LTVTVLTHTATAAVHMNGVSKVHNSLAKAFIKERQLTVQMLCTLVDWTFYLLNVNILTVRLVDVLINSGLIPRSFVNIVILSFAVMAINNRKTMFGVGAVMRACAISPWLTS